MQKTVTICSSARFYQQVLSLAEHLEQRGLTVILPSTAAKMRGKGAANVEATTDWVHAPEGYHGKALLIREHFEDIERCNAILVANYERNGQPDYIGPNVLMEMSVAFYLKRQIFVLNGIPTRSPLIDEILGLEPVFLYGELSNLANGLSYQSV